MSSVVAVLPTLVHYGYAALFVIMLLSAVYLPIPSSIGLLVAGALAHTAYSGVHFSLIIAALVGFIGNIMGDISAYFIARQFGNELRKGKLQSRHKYIAKIEKYLKKHPRGTIIVTRFIGFVSPLVNTLSGYSHLPVATFIEADVIGDALYVAIFIGAGYLLGGITSHVTTLLGGVTTILLCLVVIYVAAILFLRRSE